jgi:polar amino acid transport system permease protein
MREAESHGGYRRAAFLLFAALGAWLVLQAALGADGGINTADLVNGAPLLLKGLGLTLGITVVSLLLGAALGAAFVAGLMASARGLRTATAAACTALRGTPMLALLYLVYYGAGEVHRALQVLHLWWFFREPLNCVIFAFTLNTAAYQARIVHGAIVNLPREQTHAALALGLPRHVTMLRVLLPQALLTALRPLGNEVAKMTKASAVASLVTVLDLLGTAKYLFSQTFDFGFYILAAMLYVVLVGAIRLAVDLIEHRLLRHLRPAA